MAHPLQAIEPRLLGSVTLRLGGLLVFATALMMFVDVALQNEASPWGIVSFELAGTPYQALRILLEWKTSNALGHAKLSLITDFVYLIIYGSFFASLALWVGSRLDDMVWSLRAAWAATCAAVFDALENGVLLHEVMRFSSPAPFPQLAMAFAVVKFALLVLSASYGAIGGALVLRRR